MRRGGRSADEPRRPRRVGEAPAPARPRPVREGFAPAPPVDEPEPSVRFEADGVSWQVRVTGAHRGAGGVPLLELRFERSDPDEWRTLLVPRLDPAVLDEAGWVVHLRRARTGEEPAS